MVKYRWNEEKNEWLKQNRGFDFNTLLDNGVELDIIDNESSLHKEQQIMVVLYDNYCYAIPFVVEPDGTRFLKTAHKNRDLNKIYNLNNRS